MAATGSSILAGLEDDATWEAAKETLLSRLGASSVRDEAWASLKQLKRGSKEIIELAGEAEKLAKRLHPCDEEAAERHAVDAFLGALDRPLAAEVQKLGCRTMEEVVAAARRIERILEERPTSGMEQLIQSMRSSRRLLRLPQRLLPHPATQWRLPSHHQPLRHQPVCLVLQPHCYHPWLQHNHPCITRVALHILIMEKRVLIFVARGGSQIEGLLGASFVMRKATLPIAALPVPYYNACCGNRRRKQLEAHPGDKSWSSLPQMVAKAPLRGI